MMPISALNISEGENPNFAYIVEYEMYACLLNETLNLNI